MESLTHALAAKALGIIDETEKLGGMTRAVESGMPKLRIEEAAAKRQARVDRGTDVVVGVNKYPAPQGEQEKFDILVVDNRQVREAQIERLNKMKSSRDPASVERTLGALTHAAESGTGNILTLAIEAARARASVGEISYALEKVWGRHRAETLSISGVYGGAYSEDEKWQAMRRDVAAFEKTQGRRPRLLVVKMGQDGHDRGAKVIATAFADLGFDVDIGPLFQTPEEAARQAIENDVHVIGVSSQAAGHTTLVPELIRALKDLGAPEIIVTCGGVIPQQDYDFLKKAGVAAVFGPGTPIPVAARTVLDLVSKR
jgi:methylmalonyl-CoA mutase